MILNEIGRYVDRCWLDIPNHFPNVILHEYVIMPNHLHGIIEIAVGAKNLSPPVDNGAKNLLPPVDNGAKNLSPPVDNGAKNLLPPVDNGAKNLSPLRKDGADGGNDSSMPRGTSKTIGSIVRGFKIGVTKYVRKNTQIYTVWQRNYYEHIVRDAGDHDRIAKYIDENPIKWQKDQFFRK